MMVFSVHSLRGKRRCADLVIGLHSPLARVTDQALDDRPPSLLMAQTSPLRSTLSAVLTTAMSPSYTIAPML